jgi:hypothetical protein
VPKEALDSDCYFRFTAAVPRTGTTGKALPGSVNDTSVKGLPHNVVPFCEACSDSVISLAQCARSFQWVTLSTRQFNVALGRAGME